uniref:FMRFamide-like neuropeptide GQDFMRF-amide n=1 Tax=Delia radicum TaxID=30064 RepID=FAR2_DELRA|nr:RecName: Full=FMRFamide-like neuropeptide GQDFMRF-amide [Delia radicum]
GQDFMRF